MPSRQKDDWTVIKQGPVHPSSGYRASIVRVGRERGTLTLFNTVFFVLSPTQWLFSDPPYSVLVGREDSDGVIGVAQAKTLAKAEAEMARIDQILATHSYEDARTALGLDS